MIAREKIGGQLAADQVAKMLDPVDVRDGAGDQNAGHGRCSFDVDRRCLSQGRAGVTPCFAAFGVDRGEGAVCPLTLPRKYFRQKKDFFNQIGSNR